MAAGIHLTSKLGRDSGPVIHQAEKALGMGLRGGFAVTAQGFPSPASTSILWLRYEVQDLVFVRGV